MLGLAGRASLVSKRSARLHLRHYARRILDALDFEIKQLEPCIDRGWTTWASVLNMGALLLLSSG